MLKRQHLLRNNFFHFSQILKPGSRKSFVHGSGRSIGPMNGQIPKRRNHPIPTMKTAQAFQKISVGVSLFILALGFSSIGLMSLIHQPLSDDSLAFSAMGGVIGGWASIAVASVFIFAALLHARRHSWFTAQSCVLSRENLTS